MCFNGDDGIETAGYTKLSLLSPSWAVSVGGELWGEDDDIEVPDSYNGYLGILTGWSTNKMEIPFSFQGADVGDTIYGFMFGLIGDPGSAALKISEIKLE